MAKVVVFGTGSFAECVHFYLTHDSPHEVVAFTVNRDHIGEQTELAGLPVVAFEDLAETHPPAGYDMYVAVGYAQVNRVRARICEEARAKGYSLISYVSSKATTWGDTKIGDNVFIFEDNTIQPFVEIGDDTVLWSGNHIGHHAKIGPHCFITSHVVISGHVKVGAYCFIGVNATVRDAIAIGEANVIGSAALIMKTTQDNEVYIAPRTKPDARTSDQIGM
jgi:sugar O-acyltransferase (sialic acid O-acetyltransferase NeuD family)